MYWKLRTILRVTTPALLAGCFSVTCYSSSGVGDDDSGNEDTLNETDTFEDTDSESEEDSNTDPEDTEDTETDSEEDTDTIPNCDDWEWEKRPLGAPYLSGVWGRSSDDLWVFGPGTWQHFDGKVWSAVEGVSDWYYQSVHGNFDGSVWALMDRTLLRGNGSEFEPVYVFDEEDYFVFPYTTDLVALDSGVYIVGGWSAEYVNSVVLARFDGSEMEHLLPYNGSGAISGNVKAVWGTGDELFAVGAFGLIVHFDGVEINIMDSGVSEHLYDVSGVSETDVWAVGTYGTVIHYDGEMWSSVNVPKIENIHVHAVHATESGEVFIAASSCWDNEGAATNDKEVWNSTKIYTLVGDSFTELEPGFVGDPRGLWWNDGKTYVAGTRNGALLEAIESGESSQLYFVTDIGPVYGLAMSSSDVLCVMSSHSVRLLVDGNWHVFAMSHDDDLEDVAVLSDDSFLVAARNYDGDRPALWTATLEGLEPDPDIDHASTHLRQVFVDEDEDVWIVGNFGVGEVDDWDTAPALVHKKIQGEWVDVSPPEVEGYVWSFSAVDGEAYLTGSDGLWHFDGSVWNRIDEFEDGEAGLVYALSTNEVYVTKEGRLMLWDGAAASPVEGIGIVRVFGLEADSEGNLWVAGDYGFESDTAVLARRGASGWQLMIEEPGMFMREAVAHIDHAFAASTNDFYTGHYTGGD